MDSAPSDKNRIRILVVDDHPLVRQGIITVLNNCPDMKVVGEAGDGLQAVEQTRAVRPDLILMDIRMPQGNGIEATQRISEEFPKTKTVILSISNDDNDLFQAIEAGARGYLQKDLEPQKLVDMVRGVFKGEAPISKMATGRIMREFARRAGGNRPSLKDLSRRELQILRLMAEGCSNKEVAQTLGIALHTVKNHIHNILEKLQTDNRMKAVVFAVREGFLDSEKYLS